MSRQGRRSLRTHIKRILAKLGLFHRNAPLPIVFTMTQNVSVPEKTLEHWASLCVAYRYRSLAAQWWPVNTQAVLCRTVAGCSRGRQKTCQSEILPGTFGACRGPRTDGDPCGSFPGQHARQSLGSGAPQTLDLRRPTLDR